MGDCFELIERGMLKGPWVLGGNYSVADPYLFTIAGWLQGDGVEVKRFPKVLDHMTRMAARPAVIRTVGLQAA